MNYLSSNGMSKVFEQWSISDPNINEFGYGQLYDQNGMPKAKQVYPAMWVNPVNTLVYKNTITRQYQILLYDLVYDIEGVSNQNRLISDCEEYSFRLVRFLRTKSDIFDITGTPNIVPFNDKFLDDVSGVIITVDIEFNYESSECSDPDYSFDIKSNEV